VSAADEHASSKKWASFRCPALKTVPLEKVDPSCAVGFLVRSQQDLDNLVKTLIIVCLLLSFFE
jgi:hypothetical protein